MHSARMAEMLYMQYLGLSVQSELSRQLCDKGKVFLPGSKEFENSNNRFTQYERPTYIAAVWPADDNDVTKAVQYARLRGIPFAPRGGGHCVSNTMKALQNGIMIDMRNFNQLSYNSAKELVTAGGGVLGGDFTQYLHSIKREVTMGSCPTTSIVGLALGGGIGRMQGKYGFLCDNVVSCRLILADGLKVTASESENAELFWALRGAGQNFGIVVEITIKVYKQQYNGIHHSWDFEYSLDHTRDVFEVINQIGNPHPDLAIFILWTKNAASGVKNILVVNVVWSGIKEEAEQYVSRFVAIPLIVPFTQASVEWPELPWITYEEKNKRFLGNWDAWGVNPYKMFAGACVKFYDLDTTVDFFNDVKEVSEQYEGELEVIAVYETFSTKRTREVPDEATAFPWRYGSDNFLAVQIMSKTLEKEEWSNNWLNKWKQRWISTSGYGRLQQYMNYGHGTSILDPPEALYGYEPWRLQKLRKLKQVYDPENCFRWYQPFV